MTRMTILINFQVYTVIKNPHTQMPTHSNVKLTSINCMQNTGMQAGFAQTKFWSILKTSSGYVHFVTSLASSYCPELSNGCQRSAVAA